MKIVIIGGLASGASLASRLRRLDEKSQIILIEKTNNISYGTCGIPYYISNLIKEKERLNLVGLDTFKGRFNIDVRLEEEVLSIDKDNKSLKVKGKEEYNLSYDKLIIATGSKIKKQIDNAFTINTIKDADNILNYIDEKKIEEIAILGSNYIALELAESFYQRGLRVGIYVSSNTLLDNLDPIMSNYLERYIRQYKNINIHYNNDFKNIQESLVVDANQFIPNSDLAKKANLKLEENNSISINDKCQTSDPNIYAIGDVASIRNLINKKLITPSLANNANRMARIAADCIMGLDNSYDGSVEPRITKLFGLEIGSIGSKEEDLKDNFLTSYSDNQDRAFYFPNVKNVTTKLIFNKDDGRILGSQMCGESGVDKRINILASSIKKGISVKELQNLELTYHPNYASAKDALNIAGYSAANIISGEQKVYYAKDISTIDFNNDILLDVRSKEEYSLSTMDKAINLPLESLRDNLNKLDKNKKIYLYCKAGQRGFIAQKILNLNGFDQVYNLSGGYDLYKAYKNDDKIMAVLSNNSSEKKDIKVNLENMKIVNATGLQCPGPIMKLYKAAEELEDGQVLKVIASDPGFLPDAIAWSQRTGNLIHDSGKNEEGYFAIIVKGSQNIELPSSVKNDKTMVVFSGDFDKAIASFIIANGGAAMGRKVTMFFTFWGLNILRKSKKVKVKKTLIEKMFGFMMPRGVNKLKLSKMNMGGMGLKMIKGIMKKKNVFDLDTMIQMAKDNNIRMIACAMSMDLMGIKAEELIDGVEIGGVATYIASGENSDMNLFI